MRRLESFAPFRHRDFALFWTGAFVSNIGTWMETVAFGIYVTDKTGQALWPGLVAAATFVPTAFLGPVGGALADRLPRKAVLLTTTMVQTFFAGLITTLMIVGHPAPIVVVAVAFGSGCAAAIGFPAYQALIPDLVPIEDLTGAIALGSAQWNLGRVIGPVLAGVAIALGGIAWALAANTASFLAVAAVLLVITLPRPAPDARAVKMFASIVGGFRFVRQDPGLRVVLQTMALSMLFAAPFIALVPAMAIEVLKSGKNGTSVLVTAQGIGAVGAALAIGPLGRTRGIRWIMVRAVGLVPVALILYAVAPNLPLSALAIVVVGALYLAALSSYTTIAQQRSPAELRGRVLSLNAMLLGTVYPAAAALQGALADRFGLREVTAGSAAIMLVVLLAMHTLRPGYADAVDLPLTQARPDPATLPAS
ncbi:MAG TPA: MFS transporter [Acidimicrobiia bacterium]|nr:MFS transporter [Acidimicrobiia bacterium]